MSLWLSQAANPIPLRLACVRYITPLLLVLAPLAVFAQVTLWGEVLDEGTSEPLIGANIIIRGTNTGTITEWDGSFQIKVDSLPVVLEVSYTGFSPRILEVEDASDKISVTLVEDAVVLGTVEITGSRVSEHRKEAPLTVESLDIIAIQQTAATSFYEGLGSLKGVDLTTASLGFTIINTRGFNSTSPVRSLQIIDGVDNQSPGLNFSLGNFLGAPELDVLKVDLIQGASSAFYGPNAFNGVIDIRTKDPFIHQGLSVSLKGGERNMIEVMARYAKAFNDKWAFKLNASYLRADDWEATNYDPSFQSEVGESNPGGFDAVNIYGDENIGAARNATSPFDRVDFPGLLNFYRRGYREIDLVDYNTENIKGNVGVYYKIKPDLRAEATFNFGSGTTVYQGENRFRLDGIFFDPRHARRETHRGTLEVGQPPRVVHRLPVPPGFDQYPVGEDRRRAAAQRDRLRRALVGGTGDVPGLEDDHVRRGDHDARLVDVRAAELGPHPGVATPHPGHVLQRPPRDRDAGNEWIGAVLVVRSPGEQLRGRGASLVQRLFEQGEVGEAREFDRLAAAVLACVAVGVRVDPQVHQATGEFDPTELLGDTVVGRPEDEAGRPEHRQQIGIGGPGGAHRTDRRRQLGVEHGQQPGQTPFDEVLDHHVRCRQAALGPRIAGVVDAHGDGRPLGPAGGRHETGQRHHGVHGRTWPRCDRGARGRGGRRCRHRGRHDRGISGHQAAPRHGQATDVGAASGRERDEAGQQRPDDAPRREQRCSYSSWSTAIRSPRSKVEVTTASSGTFSHRCRWARLLWATVRPSAWMEANAPSSPGGYRVISVAARSASITTTPSVIISARREAGPAATPARRPGSAAAVRFAMASPVRIRISSWASTDSSCTRSSRSISPVVRTSTPARGVRARDRGVRRGVVDDVHGRNAKPVGNGEALDYVVQARVPAVGQRRGPDGLQRRCVGLPVHQRGHGATDHQRDQHAPHEADGERPDRVGHHGDEQAQRAIGDRGASHRKSSGHQNSTCTGPRASPSTSKYSLSVKLNMPAMMLDGKLWILVL